MGIYVEEKPSEFFTVPRDDRGFDDCEEFLEKEKGDATKKPPTEIKWKFLPKTGMFFLAWSAADSLPPVDRCRFYKAVERLRKIEKN